MEEMNNVMNEVEVIDNVEVTTDLVPSQETSAEGKIGLKEGIVITLAATGAVAIAGATVKGAKWVKGKALDWNEKRKAKKAEKKAAKETAKESAETEGKAEETPVESPAEESEKK